MKRALVTTVVAALMATALPAGLPAGAHQPDRFSLCAAKSRSGGNCRRNEHYVNAEAVWLRGKVKPPHSNSRAIILRQAEGQDSFRRVGSAPINRRGNVRWKWDPLPEDQGAYAFRMRIRGHGRSNLVNVEYAFCPACPS